MEEREILEDMAKAIMDGDEERARECARKVLQQNLDPLKAVEEGLSKGMAVLGGQFERGEIFLPDLLIAAEAFNAAMEVLKPEIEAQKKGVLRVGTVVIGTVKGDIHDIGKRIVAAVLAANGFDVVDLGTDNSSLRFVEEAEKAKARVIALSSLMTTTMPFQKEVIDILKEMKLREKYAVIVGGGPVNQDWAGRIGADGYGGSAFEAVDLVRRLLKG